MQTSPSCVRTPPGMPPLAQLLTPDRKRARRSPSLLPEVSSPPNSPHDLTAPPPPPSPPTPSASSSPPELPAIEDEQLDSEPTLVTCIFQPPALDGSVDVGCVLMSGVEVVALHAAGGDVQWLRAAVSSALTASRGRTLEWLTEVCLVNELGRVLSDDSLLLVDAALGKASRNSPSDDVYSQREAFRLANRHASWRCKEFLNSFLDDLLEMEMDSVARYNTDERGSMLLDCCHEPDLVALADAKRFVRAGLDREWQFWIRLLFAGVNDGSLEESDSELMQTRAKPWCDYSTSHPLD